MKRRFVASTFFALAAGLGIGLSTTTPSAADRKSVVVLQSEASCVGTARIELIELKKVEINEDEKIRLARGVPQDPNYRVSKAQYDDQFDREEVRIQDLYKFGHEGHVWVAYTTQSTGVVALPKKHRVDRQGGKRLGDFFEVTARGDFVTGGKLPPTALRGIHAIYGVDKTTPLDDVAFRHAQHENQPSVWRWFETTFPASRSVAAARDARQAVTLECARVALQDYQAGQCPRLQDARKLLGDAEAIAKNQTTLDVRTALDTAEGTSRTRVAEIEGLVQGTNWDQAVERSRADDFVKKFSSCYPQLAGLSDTALRQSHDQHLQAGVKLASAGRFNEAVREFEVALDRVSTSDAAKKGWCAATEGAVLADVERVIQAATSGNYERAANAIQAAQKIQCLAPSARLASKLAAVRDAWGGILFQEAESLLTTPGPPPGRVKRDKPLTVYQDEAVYRNARTKLELARSLTSQSNIAERLAVVNARLAEFRIKEATKAQSTQRFGTALVHLQQALRYDPSNQVALEKSSDLRVQVREKTEFSIGVYFEDLSRQANVNLAELLAESLRTTLAQRSSFAVLDPTVARAFYQEYERLGQVPPRFAERPYFFLVGKVLELNVRRDSRRNQVQGLERTGRNANWDQLDRAYQQADDQYNRLRQSLGDRHPQTLAARDQRDYYRRERNKYPEWNDVPYFFTRQDVDLTAATRISFRLVDCVTARILNADEVREDRKWTDYEHIGVRVNDLDFEPKSLDLPDPQIAYRALQEDVEVKLAGKGEEYLARLPQETYYARGVKDENAGSEARAIEEYILFLYSTKSPNSQEAERVRRYVIERLGLDGGGLPGGYTNQSL